MKSAAINSALSRLSPSSTRRGCGSRSSTASHGSVFASRANHSRPCARNTIDERGIVGPVATIARGFERALRRKQPRQRLHVVTQVHDAHRQRNRFAGRMRRISLAVPALEREAQRLAHVGTELDALQQHVADFAARREVVRRPLARVLLNELHDLLALLLRATGRREP